MHICTHTPHRLARRRQKGRREGIARAADRVRPRPPHARAPTQTRFRERAGRAARKPRRGRRPACSMSTRVRSAPPGHEACTRTRAACAQGVRARRATKSHPPHRTHQQGERPRGSRHTHLSSIAGADGEICLQRMLLAPCVASAAATSSLSSAASATLGVVGRRAHLRRTQVLASCKSAEFGRRRVAKQLRNCWCWD